MASGEEVVELTMNDDLEAIDIANFAEDDTILKVDSPIKENITFSFILPFVILAISLIAPFFCPKSTVRFPTEKTFEDNVFSVSMERLTPWNSQLSLTLEFETPVTIEGQINITLMLDGMLVLQNAAAVSQANVTNLLAFATENIDFDQINISINAEVEAKCTAVWIYGNEKYAYFMAAARIVFTICILPALLKTISRVTSKSSKPTTLEQRLTMILLPALFCIVDPLFILQNISPSPLQLVRNAAFRDFGFGYVCFYTLALFSFFTREKGPQDRNTLVLSLALPYLFTVCTIIFLLTTDVMGTTSSLLLPRSFQPRDSVSPFHFIASVSLLITVIIRVGMVVSGLRKVHQTRFNHYTIVCVTVLLFFVIVITLRCFTDLLEGTAAAKIIPYGLVVFFGLFMDWAHENVKEDELGPQYQQPVDGEGGDENPIGVDEDPNIIEQNQMLQSLDNKEEV